MKGPWWRVPGPGSHVKGPRWRVPGPTFPVCRFFSRTSSFHYTFLKFNVMNLLELIGCKFVIFCVPLLCFAS